MNLNINSTTLTYDDTGIAEARVSYNKRSDGREVRLNGRQTLDGETYIANMAPDALSDIIGNYIVEQLDDLQIIVNTINFAHDVEGESKVLREVSVEYTAEHNQKGNRFDVSGTIVLTVDEYEGNESVPALEGIAKDRIREELGNAE